MPQKTQSDYKGITATKPTQSTSRMITSNTIHPSNARNVSRRNSETNGTMIITSGEAFGQRINDTNLSLLLPSPTNTHHHMNKIKPSTNPSYKVYTPTARITSPQYTTGPTNSNNNPMFNSHPIPYNNSTNINGIVCNNIHVNSTPSYKKNCAYMVNNDEFPSLSDSNTTILHSGYDNNSLNINDTIPHNNNNNIHENFYISKGNDKNDIFNNIMGSNDLSMCYILPTIEIANTTNIILEESIVETVNECNKEITKDPATFIITLRLKKYTDGISSLLKMFPLINQVKLSYPYSKFSVGACVDNTFNSYHLTNKTIDPITYIVPCIGNCPITSIYRVNKHLMDYFVPLDYLTLAKFHEKSPFSCDKYSDEILLYLYYSHAGDGLQMLAAYHLHRRGWRFHLEKYQWITLTSDQCKSFTIFINSKKSTQSLITDTFWVFNIFNWRMEKIETTLDIKSFENVEIYAEFLHEATNSYRNRQNSNNKSSHNITNILSNKCYNNSKNAIQMKIASTNDNT